MSGVNLILSVINWLLMLVGIIGVIGFALMPFIGIIFIILYSNEKDLNKKEKIKKWGIITAVSPIVMVIASIILVVVLQATRGLLGIGIE